MEATPKTSRKRKQTSSTSQVRSPFTGALTRQKSQKYFFNRNRSGKSRKCRPFQHPSSQLPPIIQPQSRVHHVSSDGNGGGDDDDEEYHISIKDLRARRVLSAPPEKQILGKVENPRFGSDLIDCKIGYSDGFGENPSFSIGEKSGSGVGLNGGNPYFSMLKKCDLEVNVKSDDSDSDSGENEKLGLSIDISDMLEKCDDLLDSMIGCSRRRNPNLSVSSEKCEPVIKCGNPNLSVPNKCDETRVGFKGEGFKGGNPNFSVLKKCRSVVGVGSSNLVVSEKCDDSRVGFVEEGLNGGVLNQEISYEKCESVMNGEASNVVGSVNSGKPNSLEKCGMGLDDMSPNLSDKDEKSRVGGNCVVVNEENELTTPPNAVVLARRCDELNALQGRSSVSRSLTLTNQISTCKEGSAEGKKFPNTKKDMTLKRCSRQKVFKVPNSFSYRRLLPYLMDIAKDDPCELEVHSTVKSVADVEAKPVVSSSHENVTDGSKLNGETLVTMAASVSQEVSIDSKDEQSMDSKASNPSAEVAAVPIAANCSAVGSGIGSQHDLKPALSQDENTSSDDLGKLGDVTSTGEGSTAAALYSPEASRNHSSDLESPCNLSVVAGGDCRAADIRVPNGEILISKCHGSSKLVAVVSSGVPVVGLANGILKKNPRGCRGICSCLNCASFRLNAEKAFEFSRNQLLEAEELAKDLMTEISNLRCMLEKSATGATEAKILPDNQVHEACRRACKVEDMARCRLSQMNEDLFVHCRTKALQRPRVNFSRNIQEKAIWKLTKLKDTKASSKSAGMNDNLSR